MSRRPPRAVIVRLLPGPAADAAVIDDAEVAPALLVKGSRHIRH